MKQNPRHILSIGLAVATAVLTLAIALLPAAAAETSHEANWLTDFAKAKELASKANKPILINFSGSDWCGWCHKLDDEVLTKEAFKEYAKKSLVLFNADFPRRTKLPEALKQQNEALAKQYEVRGFPTVLLVNAQGKVLAQTGYRAGGPAKYVQHLKSLVAKTGK